MKTRCLVALCLPVALAAGTAACGDDDGKPVGYASGTGGSGGNGAAATGGGSMTTGGATASGGTDGNPSGGAAGEPSGGTGGTEQTGGTGGALQVAGAGGAAGSPPASNCFECITENCENEFNACNTDLCIYEFQCTQACIGSKVSATEAVTQQDRDDCVADCATQAFDASIPGATGAVSGPMSAIYTCISEDPWCTHYCYGGPEPT